MINERGSVGIVCLGIVTAVLLLCQGVYSLIESDYKYLKTYTSQKQCAHASISGLQALEGLSAGLSGNFQTQLHESLNEGESLFTQLNIYREGNVQWLSSKTKNSVMSVQSVMANVEVVDVQNSLYKHTLVAKVFNINSTAILTNASIHNYTDTVGGNFPILNLANYSRFARLMPDSNIWQEGLGRNIFYADSGNSLNLPANRLIKGMGVFVNRGDIYIGSNSKYPENTHFISNGNIIVGNGVQLDKAFLFANASVKISSNSRVSGKIFAKNGIVLEANAQVQDIAANLLNFTTDKYLW